MTGSQTGGRQVPHFASLSLRTLPGARSLRLEVRLQAISKKGLTAIQSFDLEEIRLKCCSWHMCQRAHSEDTAVLVIES
jgi:hypothetical protein